MTIHICYPLYDDWGTHEQYCPTCESEQDFWCIHAEWYGWTKTCLNCGDSWCDEGREERPFQRGWRKKAIAAAIAQRESLSRLPYSLEV